MEPYKTFDCPNCNDSIIEEQLLSCQYCGFEYCTECDEGICTQCEED